MKKVIVFFLLLFTAVSVSWAQNEAETPPKVESNLFGNPYKRTPLIVKDRISSNGVRFIWGNYNYARIGGNDKTKNLMVRVFATQLKDSIVNFYLRLGIRSADERIKVKQGSPVLFKLSDDSIVEKHSLSEADDIGTVTSIMGHVYTEYYIYVDISLDGELINSIKKGLKKIRVEVNRDIYDVELKSDNISKFIIDEYMMIRKALHKKRDFREDF